MYCLSLWEHSHFGCILFCKIRIPNASYTKHVNASLSSMTCYCGLLWFAVECTCSVLYIRLWCHWFEIQEIRRSITSTNIKKNLTHSFDTPSLYIIVSATAARSFQPTSDSACHSRIVSCKCTVSAGSDQVPDNML